MKIEINEYLLKLFHLVKDLGDIDFFWGKAKLSRTEFRILWEVANEQCMGRDIISSELARRIGITRSAVSQIVNKLEQANVVRRVPDVRDRKIAYVELTEEAYGIYESVQQRVNRVLDGIIAQFGEERVERLMTDASEFVDAFNEAVRAEEGACARK